MTVLDSDTFTRANQSAWGTASSGSVWARKTGTMTWDITSNEGQQDTGAGTNFYQLGSTTVLDAEALVRTSASATADTIGVCLRATGTTTYYWAKLTSGTAAIMKNIRSTNTTLATNSFTFSANTFYWIRFRVVGTNLYMKVWQDGSGEPAAWTTTVTGDSSITTAGGYGLRGITNTAGDIIKFDSYTVYNVYSPTEQTIAKFYTQVKGAKTETVDKFYTQIKGSVSAARSKFYTKMSGVVSKGVNKFYTRMSGVKAEAVSKFYTRVSTSIRSIAKFYTKTNSAVRTRAKFFTRSTAITRSVPRFYTRISATTKSASNFLTNLHNLLPAQATFSISKSSAVRTVIRFVTLVIHKELKSSFSIVPVLSSTFVSKPALHTTFSRETPLSNPYSTVVVNSTLQDYNNNLQPSATVSVSVLFPDGTTSTYTSGNGLVNMGNGVYELTYTTKGAGLHREYWTYTNNDGTTLQATNINIASY